MAEIKFPMQGGLVGSAARRAEHESRADTTVPGMTVRAGSAARAAEESKRAGLSNTPSRAVRFSLRAQAGVLQRTAAALTAPPRHIECADQAAAHSLNDTPSKSDLPALPENSSVPVDLPTAHHPSASMIQQVAIGVQAILQRMFSALGKDS